MIIIFEVFDNAIYRFVSSTIHFVINHHAYTFE